MAKRRKRGRPRTGSKPVVPVRLPPAWIKKIDAFAEVCGVDRSAAVRAVVQIGLNSAEVTLLLRRPGKGKGAVHSVISVAAAASRAKVAQSALMRTPSVAAEIKALRAEAELEEALAVEADRRARRRG